MNNTQIFASLGPASENPQVIKSMVKAGADGFCIPRLQQYKNQDLNQIEVIHELEKVFRRELPILLNLTGPHIHIENFSEYHVELRQFDQFILDTNCNTNSGNTSTVGINYKDLPRDLQPGDTLFLNYGVVELLVDHIDGSQIICRVIKEGRVGGHHVIHKKGGGFAVNALTNFNKNEIDLLSGFVFDYVVIPYVKDKEDVLSFKKLIRKVGSKAKLLARIERAEAIENIEEILGVTEGIVIDRDGLGAELGWGKVPALCLKLIKQAHEKNRMIVLSDGVLDSMVENSKPTHAELFDVALAVENKVDAVLITGPTAVGRFPVNTVSTVKKVIDKN